MTENTSTDKLARLEEEGEPAADYFEGFLDIADLGGDIEIDVENGRASVEIISEHSSGPDRLVGEDGETLDALQEPTYLAVQTETGERSRLMLDIAGFRAEHKAKLQDFIMEAIARLRATGEAQKFEVMNPFEHKVRRDVVIERGFLPKSEGVEPHRCIAILPAEEGEVEEAETERSKEG